MSDRMSTKRIIVSCSMISDIVREALIVRENFYPHVDTLHYDCSSKEDYINTIDNLKFDGIPFMVRSLKRRTFGQLTEDAQIEVIDSIKDNNNAVNQFMLSIARKQKYDEDGNAI